MAKTMTSRERQEITMRRGQADRVPARPPKLPPDAPSTEVQRNRFAEAFNAINDPMDSWGLEGDTVFFYTAHPKFHYREYRRPSTYDNDEELVQELDVPNGRLAGIELVSPVGLFVEAEHTWNSSGRSLDETFCAYAAGIGVKEPQKQAESYRLFDDANFNQGIRNSVCIGQPPGSFSRFNNMLERIRDNDKVDELIMLMVDAMEVDDLPVLAKSINVKKVKTSRD